MKQQSAIRKFPIYDDSPYYWNNVPFKFETMTMACLNTTHFFHLTEFRQLI